MDALGVITLFLYNIVVYNIALLYGTVGEIITEKSGSLNLGVEGTMAVGAIGGYLVGCSADNLFAGIVASFAISALMGLIFAFLTVSLRANQNVTGLTLTTFGLGLYFFIGKGLSDTWPLLSSKPGLMRGLTPLHIPYLSDVPIIGKGLLSHNVLVYLGIAIAVLAYVYINKTKPGLKMRAIGENPAAADAAGINITLHKYASIMIGSGIMGIGGYQMGLNLGGSFEGSNCWINGYGWIAVALVIFASWNPAKAILGTLIFGFFNTLHVYGGSLATAFPSALGWLKRVPSQLYEALPFIITALVLMVNSMMKSKKTEGPAAIGVGYYREDR